MPWNGSGTYTAAAAPNFPAVGGATISSIYYNAVINDLVTAMNNALCKDGQNRPSAAINWNGQNLTNVGTFSCTTFSATALSGTTVTATGAISGLSYVCSGGGATITKFDIDGTLAANSDSNVATQKAVKTYVDNAVTSVQKLKGGTDCSANPNYPAAIVGDAYYVTVAGKIGGASGIAVDVGDMFVCSIVNAGGTQAAVGADWIILEHNLVGALLVANALSELSGVAATARANIGAAARTPNVQTVASAATVTPTFANDMVTVTAQAVALALANPTGTALEGWGIVIRIKDNGTARAITFDTQYRAVGSSLPTTTIISKTLYIGMIFNNVDTKWDVVSVMEE